MSSTVSSSLTHAGGSTDREELVRCLPAKARAVFERFEADGDTARLGPVILTILEGFIPRTPDRPLAEFLGSACLIADLGFDSLSLSEAMLSVEDLFGIRISNAEITAIRTLDELRDLIVRKVAGPVPR